MAGGVISTAQIFGLTVRESANDGSDFTNPGADYRRWFVGESGSLYLKDSAGAVTLVAAGAGTANPSSPNTNDRFYRTDLGRLIYYDGTRWLTVQEFTWPVPMTDAVQFTGISASTNTVGRGSVPPLANGSWLTRYSLTTFVATTNNGTNFWTVTPQWLAGDGTATAFTTFTTGSGPDTASTYTEHVVTLGSVLDSTARAFRVNTTKTLTPGNLIVIGSLVFHYRLIVT